MYNRRLIVLVYRRLQAMPYPVRKNEGAYLQAHRALATPWRGYALSGLISPIELKSLQSVPGVMGLVRMVVGMEDVRNPPATLFESDFYYAWNRVKDSSRFEMNLEIPVGEQVEIKSLGELAKDLNENPPSTLDDTRCKQFDRAIDRLLDWLVKCFEVDYPYICLLNPENILVLRWSGWQQSEDDSISPVDPAVEATRVILPDMGFLLKAGGTLPGWLKADNPYKFLWGNVPEKVYHRRYPEQWYLRVVARLIAFLLMDDCGVQSESGLIEPRVLNQLPKKAAAWDVLEQALTGGFDEQATGDTAINRLDALRIKLVEHPPSHHFSMRHEPKAGEPPFGVSKPPPSRRRWLHASLSILLLAAVLLVVWFYIYRPPGLVCDCCPNVSASSPIFGQLQQIDALRNPGAQDATNVPSAMKDIKPTQSAVTDSEPETDDSQSAQKKSATPPDADRSSSLPIRSNGVAVELGLILAAEESYDNFKTQNPTTSISVADKKCLDALRKQYLDKLFYEFQIILLRLESGTDPVSIRMLCQIQGELKLFSADGEDGNPSSGTGQVPPWITIFNRTCIKYHRWLRDCNPAIQITASENKKISSSIHGE